MSISIALKAIGLPKNKQVSFNLMQLSPHETTMILSNTDEHLVYAICLKRRPDKDYYTTHLNELWLWINQQQAQGGRIHWYAAEQTIIKPNYRIYRSDAISLLLSLPDKSIDMTLTDPAYASMEKARSIGTTTRLKNKWFPVFDDDRYHEFFQQLYRVMKRSTFSYIMCNDETRDIIKPAAIKAGFKYWKCLVWDKYPEGAKNGRGMGYHHPASIEYFMMLEKPKRQLNFNNQRDILAKWPCLARKKYVDDREIYATEKPKGLGGAIIEEATHQGDLVLDPFGGSFVFGYDALNLGRRFIGGDLLQESVDLGAQRLLRFATHGPLLPGIYT